jgi:hypothetical protein
MTTIDRISGRDCMNPVKLSNKINEIISFLEENELLTKNEYEKMLNADLKK